MGKRLGPEHLKNTTFDDAANLSIEEPGSTTVSGGALHFASTGASEDVNFLNAETFTAGKTYRAVLTISNYTEGVIVLLVGNVFGTARSANGTFTELITPTVTGAASKVRPGTASTTLDIEGVSVREVL
jgi:hypothetical protein